MDVFDSLRKRFYKEMFFREKGVGRKSPGK